MSSQDTKQVEFITRTTKAVATGYALGAAPELAAKVENSLVDGTTLADVQREIKRRVANRECSVVETAAASP